MRLGPKDLRTIRACTVEQLEWFLWAARDAVRCGLEGHRQTVKELKRELRLRRKGKRFS